MNEEFTSIFGNRSNEKRWHIVCASYSGLERFAVNELQRMLQNFLHYVIPVEVSENLPETTQNVLALGQADSPLFSQLINSGAVASPEFQEGYNIACSAYPDSQNDRLITLCGKDARGVLYAVEEFNARILGRENIQDDPKWFGKILNELPDFSFSNYPRIAYRGIWTWGYAIYDYRNFFDNMARLRFNAVTIWHDELPLNIMEVIDYAHSRGIEVILGFHCGWGKDNIDLSDPHQIEELAKRTLELYKRDYAVLPHDGIYMQTVTESNETSLKGRPVAEWACKLYNQVGKRLLDEFPQIKRIQFGVHATSILDDYTCFENLDSRISLIWEDAGVIPYSYIPAPEYKVDETNKAVGLGSVEATSQYSAKLATLRNNAEFAMVAKGFSYIRWMTEFENHKSFILGERSNDFIRKRLAERLPRWRKNSALWFAHYRKAVEFFRCVKTKKLREMFISALIEDGMFEARIDPAVALFASMIWNPEQEFEAIMESSQSAWFDFNSK